jgi:thymidylate synthase ThyX
MMRLRELGVAEEFAAYLLPNAVAVRFTESSDLLNLHHKLKSRLCYNAQEEIWRASLDEARQISAVEPAIGRYLLPPCGLRQMTETRPLCPEGERYCGVPVWKLELDEYARVI